MINQVSGMFKECTDIRFAQINYWSFIQSLDHNVLESREKAYGHAAEAGTSVMMHLYPDLVDENQFVNEMPRHRNAFPEITQYLGLSTMTESGVIGNAKLASQQKGEIIVDNSVDRIVSFLNETWGICETY
jgi:creatinine amidohydrolase